MAKAAIIPNIITVKKKLRSYDLKKKIIKKDYIFLETHVLANKIWCPLLRLAIIFPTIPYRQRRFSNFS